jgi:hypothetical protein
MADLSLINRVPGLDNNRLTRFTEQVRAVFNSLTYAGVLVQTGPGKFALNVQNQLAIEFEWNNAAVRLIGTIPAGRVAARVRVILTEAFADPTSSLTVGTLADPDRLLDGNDVSLDLGGEFEKITQEQFATATALYLTLAPAGGESAGAGFVVIEYEPNR